MIGLVTETMDKGSLARAWAKRGEGRPGTQEGKDKAREKVEEVIDGKRVPVGA